jgi:DNA polymerase elongation subunit (family B)
MTAGGDGVWLPPLVTPVLGAQPTPPLTYGGSHLPQPLAPAGGAPIVFQCFTDELLDPFRYRDTLGVDPRSAHGGPLYFQHGVTADGHTVTCRYDGFFPYVYLRLPADALALPVEQLVLVLEHVIAYALHRSRLEKTRRPLDGGGAPSAASAATTTELPMEQLSVFVRHHMAACARVADAKAAAGGGGRWRRRDTGDDDDDDDDGAYTPVARAFRGIASVEPVARRRSLIEGWRDAPLEGVVCVRFKTQWARTMLTRGLAYGLVPFSTRAPATGMHGRVYDADVDALVQLKNDVFGTEGASAWMQINRYRDTGDRGRRRRAHHDVYVRDVHDGAAAHPHVAHNRRRRLAPLVAVAFDLETVSDRRGTGLPRPQYVRTDKIVQVSLVFWRPGVDGDAPFLRYVATVEHACAPVDNCTVEVLATEEALIARVYELCIERYNVTLFTGHNIYTYDWEWLVERARNRYPSTLYAPVVLRAGRLKDVRTPLAVKRKSNNGGLSKMLRWHHMGGRISLDTLMYFLDNYKYASYSLGFIASEELGRTKEDMHFTDIARFYNSAQPELIARLAEYNYRDSELVATLVTRFGIVLEMLTLAALCNIHPESVHTHGQEHRLFPLITSAAHASGFLVDTTFREAMVGVKGAVKEGYMGATVLTPIVGLWDDVATLDFTSLYPSIMLVLNACYSTSIPLALDGSAAASAAAGLPASAVARLRRLLCLDDDDAGAAPMAMATDDGGAAMVTRGHVKEVRDEHGKVTGRFVQPSASADGASVSVLSAIIEALLGRRRVVKAQRVVVEHRRALLRAALARATGTAPADVLTLAYAHMHVHKTPGNASLTDEQRADVDGTVRAVHKKLVLENGALNGVRDAAGHAAYYDATVVAAARTCLAPPAAPADVAALRAAIAELAFESNVLNVQQKSLKVVANSCYGLTAGGRLLDGSEIAESVCVIGRAMLVDASDTVNAQQWHDDAGNRVVCTVVYGDTDSIMVDYRTVYGGTARPDDAGERMRRHIALAQRQAGVITALLRAKYGAAIDLKFECVKHHFLLTKKKKYAALEYEAHNKPPKLEIKGLVNRAVCGVTRKALMAFLRAVLYSDDPRGAGLRAGVAAVQRIVRALRTCTWSASSDATQSPLNFMDFVKSSRLGKPLADYGDNVQHAVYAKRLLAEHPEYAENCVQGSRVWYVQTLDPVHARRKDVKVGGVRRVVVRRELRDTRKKGERYMHPMIAVHTRAPLDVAEYEESIHKKLADIMLAVEVSSMRERIVAERATAAGDNLAAALDTLAIRTTALPPPPSSRITDADAAGDTGGDDINDIGSDGDTDGDDGDDESAETVLDALLLGDEHKKTAVRRRIHDAVYEADCMQVKRKAACSAGVAYASPARLNFRFVAASAAAAATSATSTTTRALGGGGALHALVAEPVARCRSCSAALTDEAGLRAAADAAHEARLKAVRAAKIARLVAKKRAAALDRRDAKKAAKAATANGGGTAAPRQLSLFAAFGVQPLPATAPTPTTTTTAPTPLAPTPTTTTAAAPPEPAPMMLDATPIVRHTPGDAELCDSCARPAPKRAFHARIAADHARALDYLGECRAACVSCQQTRYASTSIPRAKLQRMIVSCSSDVCATQYDRICAEHHLTDIEEMGAAVHHPRIGPPAAATAAHPTATAAHPTATATVRGADAWYTFVGGAR